MNHLEKNGQNLFILEYIREHSKTSILYYNFMLVKILRPKGLNFKR